MAQVLFWLTAFVNLLGLAVALCLGLYSVTRTPHRRLSWLAALTLWAVTGFYLHNTLILTLPGSGVLPLLRLVVILALALGFHLTLLLPPEKERGGRDFYLPPIRLPDWVRARLARLEPPVSRLATPLAYGLGLLLMVGGVFPLGLPPEAPDGPAVYLSDRASGPLYPLALVYLVVLQLLALLHLWQSRGAEQGTRRKRRYRWLFAAVILTGLGGLYLGLGVHFGLDLPSFPGDLAVGFAALILGYTVARYHALVEGRDIRRDLLYIALIIGSFTLSYLIVAEVLYLGGHTFSALTLILIIIVAVSSLMLYDGLRATLDRLFYREQFRELRANLRALAREAGVGQTLPDRLQAILSALCRTMRIRRGFVALPQGDAYVVCASEGASPPGQTYALPLLESGEATPLPRPGSAAPEGMRLLIPIYGGDNQIGALVLGAKEVGEEYGEDDLILLEDLADQLAIVIQTMGLQDEKARIISDMVSDFREREQALQGQMQRMLAERQEEAQPILQGMGDQQFVSLVEDALRRLHDYPYLGEHPLAQLQVVDWCLQGSGGDFVTHLDRGKALSDVLARALHKLRPEGREPARQAIPSREWHQFLILHDAYVLGELNRDIMSRLYVGEGTFNRSRRRALRGVARAVQEMEWEARQRA